MRQQATGNSKKSNNEKIHENNIAASMSGLFVRQSKIGNPKWWGIFAIAFTFALGGAVAEAQQTGKVPA